MSFVADMVNKKMFWNSHTMGARKLVDEETKEKIRVFLDGGKEKEKEMRVDLCQGISPSRYAYRDEDFICNFFAPFNSDEMKENFSINYNEGKQELLIYLAAIKKTVVYVIPFYWILKIVSEKRIKIVQFDVIVDLNPLYISQL